MPDLPFYVWFLMVSGAVAWIGGLIIAILVWWMNLVSDEVPNKIPRSRRVFRKRWAS